MQAILRNSILALALFLSVPLLSSAQFRALQPEGQSAGSYRAMQDSLADQQAMKSPALATLMSAVVPGSGQIYAERYWTLPLIWGFGYWFVRQYISQDSKYNEWREKYSQSLAKGAEDAYAKYVRDFYRDQRDSFAFYLALTYVLNIVDAYVGASLYNFDVSDDLGGTANIRLQLRLPIR